MYLMLGTRLDLAYSIGFLSRTLKNPSAEDVLRGKREFVTLPEQLIMAYFIIIKIIISILLLFDAIYLINYKFNKS